MVKQPYSKQNFFLPPPHSRIDNLFPLAKACAISIIVIYSELVR